MRTVKEISAITGISVRTLHYYDEIGLLRPTEEDIRRRLIEKRDYDLDSFAVRKLIGEYGFVMKQLLQLKEEEGMMLSLARSYRSEMIAPEIDRQYDEGAAEFFARAIEAFYRR